MKATVTANFPDTKSLLSPTVNSSALVTEEKPTHISIILDGMLKDNRNDDSIVLTWPLKEFKEMVAKALNQTSGVL
jgi:hypothetical protein